MHVNEKEMHSEWVHTCSEWVSVKKQAKITENVVMEETVWCLRDL